MFFLLLDPPTEQRPAFIARYAGRRVRRAGVDFLGAVGRLPENAVSTRRSGFSLCISAELHRSRNGSRHCHADRLLASLHAADWEQRLDRTVADQAAQHMKDGKQTAAAERAPRSKKQGRRRAATSHRAPGKPFCESGHALLRSRSA